MSAPTHSNRAADSNEMPRTSTFFSPLARSKLISIFYCIYVYTVTQTAFEAPATFGVIGGCECCGVTGCFRAQAVLRVPEVVALKRTSWSLNRRRLPTRQASATIRNYLGKLA